MAGLLYLLTVALFAWMPDIAFLLKKPVLALGVAYARGVALEVLSRIFLTAFPLCVLIDLLRSVLKRFRADTSPASPGTSIIGGSS